ncbi:MAG TPA: response regulator [Thermoanaerobaculaceae bacterium]|nr:response regulator [Thermoanaerobaculaceae bacterium]HRS15946.1 response regulator [Thermoanaerobaculaceae bacterium]
MKGDPLTILLVEDDDAHAEIVRRNFEGFRVANRLVRLEDGQAALDYLLHEGAYAAVPPSRPVLVLLDLRLPKVDGIEVLRRIKTHPELSRIPVVVLTTSSAETDMVQAYDCHANSYLVKPVEFPKFVALMETLGYYWLAWNRHPFAE